MAAASVAAQMVCWLRSHSRLPLLQDTLERMLQELQTLPAGTRLEYAVDVASQGEQVIFIGQLTAVLTSAIQYIFMPDIKCDHIEYARRVLVGTPAAGHAPAVQHDMRLLSVLLAALPQCNCTSRPRPTFSHVPSYSFKYTSSGTAWRMQSAISSMGGKPSKSVADQHLLLPCRCPSWCCRTTSMMSTTTACSTGLTCMPLTQQ